VIDPEIYSKSGAFTSYCFCLKAYWQNFAIFEKITLMLGFRRLQEQNVSARKSRGVKKQAIGFPV